MPSAPGTPRTSRLSISSPTRVVHVIAITWQIEEHLVRRQGRAHFCHLHREHQTNKPQQTLRPPIIFALPLPPWILTNLYRRPLLHDGRYNAVVIRD